VLAKRMQIRFVCKEVEIGVTIYPFPEILDAASFGVGASVLLGLVFGG